MKGCLHLQTWFAWSLCLAPLAVSANERILPLEGNAWIARDGIRAAWLSYKQIDDAMVSHLLASRVNTVFLKHGFHDLLDLETARWEEETLVVNPRERTQQRILENTERAARNGIHVFWLANYELEQMLPHLKRLGYQPAYAEGPGRYLKTGEHADAAPLDPVFWRGLTGAHGEIIAKLSQKHPIAGLLYDTEHYAGGMMYLQNSGFSDPTFKAYAESRRLTADMRSTPRGKRYAFLKNSGRLEDYDHYLEEAAYEQGRYLATRWHAINPHLVLGVWPLLDNWFSQGFLRGLGGAVPALGLSGVEYYHGADQSASMAAYFESRNPNLIYMPGFYPPYAYSVDQLKEHVTKALQGPGHYWMLGPHEELGQPVYQSALREAHISTNPSPSAVDSPISLSYQVEATPNGPLLIVETSRSLDKPPKLSLWSSHGGAPLCEGHLMQKTESGLWQARLPLRRRITANNHLPHGYRSGASYKLEPQPLAYRYEDPYHTKLIDGRAYGYFGTSVAWPETVNRSSVEFDLHRIYRIARVEISQPRKLEDRHGGPTALHLQLKQEGGEWSDPNPFGAHFEIASQEDSPTDTAVKSPIDPRHNRAWLSWRADLAENPARWARIQLKRTHPNTSISLGEIVIWATISGEIHAQVESNHKILRINPGRRWTIE